MRRYARAQSASISRTTATLAIALLAVSAGTVSGQEVTRTLEPGTLVRVRMAQASSSVVATIVSARPDTLVLGRRSRLESRIPLPISQIRQLEVSAGRRQLAPLGAVGGFLLGAAVVGGYNSIRQSQCFGECPEPASFLIGGAVGGLIGGVGLSFVRAERWVEISLPRRSESGTRPLPSLH